MRLLQGTTPRAGFTVVEMAVAMLLLSVLGGVFFLTTETTSSAVRTGMAVSELDAEALRVLDRVCEVLKGSSSDKSTPQGVSPFSECTVDLQRGLGADADGKVQWGPVERFALVYDDADDGLDDDDDGLVDEGRLEWVESPGTADERRTVLTRNVAEYLEGETFDGLDENDNGLLDERGFALDFDDEHVTVRLTLVARDPNGQPLASTVQRSVAFRNRGN